MEDHKIFFAVDQLKAMTAMHLLEEAGIHAHKVDRRDSAYTGILGKIEIHVGKEDEAKAKDILMKAEVLDADD
jgi:type III secretory pathway lipoprotein EscJ